MIFDSASADILGATVMDMVAIKTLSGQERPMADYVENFLRTAGIRFHRDEHENVLRQ